MTEDGVVDEHDLDHVNVTREGDGGAGWGFGYVYTLTFQGRPHYRGLSTVLGGVEQLEVVGPGSTAGCADVGGVEEVVVGAVSVNTTGTDAGTDARFGVRELMPSRDVRGVLRPGDRIRSGGGGRPNHNS